MFISFFLTLNLTYLATKGCVSDSCILRFPRFAHCKVRTMMIPDTDGHKHRSNSWSWSSRTTPNLGDTEYQQTKQYHQRCCFVVVATAAATAASFTQGGYAVDVHRVAVIGVTIADADSTVPALVVNAFHADHVAVAEDVVAVTVAVIIGITDSVVRAYVVDTFVVPADVVVALDNVDDIVVVVVVAIGVATTDTVAVFIVIIISSRSLVT